MNPRTLMCFSHKHRISCFCCSYSCNRKVHMKLTLNYFIIMRPKARIAVLYGLLFNHWAVNLSRSEKHPFEQLMRFLHGAAGSDCGMFILRLQTVHSLHVLRVFVHFFILLWQNALRCLQTALITWRSFDVWFWFQFDADVDRSRYLTPINIWEECRALHRWQMLCWVYSS